MMIGGQLLITCLNNIGDAIKMKKVSIILIIIILLVSICIIRFMASKYCVSKIANDLVIAINDNNYDVVVFKHQFLYYYFFLGVD